MPSIPQAETILTSGSLSYGAYGREFEEMLRVYFNTRNLIVTNTYSMSIVVALTTIGLKQQDKVIASPMACLASSQPLLNLGLEILWADVDPLTGTLDPNSVKELIKEGPKAIIHNHFCGYPGHIDEINEIGRSYGIPVIDDCIEAFGSVYKLNKLGCVGSDVTIFSFSSVRFPNTLDGGAIIFKQREFFEQSLLIRDYGIDRTKFRDKNGEINPHCDISLIGYNATPMELNSYIGVEQMKRVDEILAQQSANGQEWDKLLGKNKDIVPLRSVHGKPNFWVYGILVPDKLKYIDHFRSKGFYASGVHLNNNMYSVFKNQKELKGVSAFQSRFLALPSGWWLKDIEFN